MKRLEKLKGATVIDLILKATAHQFLSFIVNFQNLAQRKLRENILNLDDFIVIAFGSLSI